MAKLSMARRRVVVMASGVTMLAAAGTPLGHEASVWFHVSALWVVLPILGLEIVAFGFLVKALARIKADEGREAAEKGSGEA